MSQNVEGEPRWSSRDFLVILAALIAPLALAIVGSFLAVPVAYALLFVEADVIVYLVIRMGRSSQASASPVRPDGLAASPVFLSADRVDALTSLVKWAGKGSDYSRREIALATTALLRRAKSDEGRSGSLFPDERLAAAVKVVVQPYRDDTLVKAEAGPFGNELFGRSPDGTSGSHKVRRGRYLTSLEEILSKLEGQREAKGGPS